MYASRGLVELLVSSGVEQRREPVDERLRGARRRRHRDVVRHRRPEARRREAGRAARVVEHADDPGRALVARGLQAELLDQVGVGRARGDRRRPRVRHVGEQRAERDDELDAELAARPRRRATRTCASAGSARCRAGASRRARRPAAARVEGVLRPVDPARLAVERARPCGRVAWKSKKRSGSISANRRPPRRARGTRRRATRPARRRSSRGTTRRAPGARAPGRSSMRSSSVTEPSYAGRCGRQSVETNAVAPPRPSPRA